MSRHSSQHAAYVAAAASESSARSRVKLAPSKLSMRHTYAPCDFRCMATSCIMVMPRRFVAPLKCLKSVNGVPGPHRPRRVMYDMLATSAAPVALQPGRIQFEAVKQVCFWRGLRAQRRRGPAAHFRTVYDHSHDTTRHS